MSRPVLLYDGECGLCNRLVRQLLRTDRAQRLQFTTLQGAAGQAYLRMHGLPTTDFDSLVFAPDWDDATRRPLLRTEGALAAAVVVGGAWRLITWLRIFPAWLRDPFYKLIARTRYALFGEFRGVPLAESEWKDRFLI
jgi:predicted DCC family thiol-disulfide oxidoreductase YuxK